MATTRMQAMRDERIAHLDQLKALGLKPFPAQSTKDQTNQYVVDHYDELEGQSLHLTGRVMSLRHHGQLAFIDLEDESGKIQIYLKGDVLEETSSEKQTIGFEHLGLLDSGDFIQVYGEVTRTKRGQISLMSTRLTMLAKSLRPLPNQHDVATDREFMFRRRYVDLATNRERREMFKRKSAFWRANRRFLEDNGFIEVETPVLEHVTGGADAQPFVTHMNALDQDFFLRISTELYQKRLIGGGFEKVFTIGPNFRNEGLSEEHLTEYSQTEWYWAYADFRDNMELTKQMFRYIAKEVYGKTAFTTRGHTFDLADEWVEISYPDIIKERHGIDIFESTDEEILAVIQKNQVKLDGAVNRSRMIDNLWKLIRKDIAGPAFLINEPAVMSPLSKSRADMPNLTERYHVILGGSELANGYSELNDPFEQLERFRDQQSQRDAGDAEAQMMDIDYVEMLEFGMPPTSGHGHSERLFWFFEDCTAREGTLFPALKRKTSLLTKKIYGLEE